MIRVGYNLHNNPKHHHIAEVDTNDWYEARQTVFDTFQKRGVIRALAVIDCTKFIKPEEPKSYA